MTIKSFGFKGVPVTPFRETSVELRDEEPVAGSSTELRKKTFATLAHKTKLTKLYVVFRTEMFYGNQWVLFQRGDIVHVAGSLAKANYSTQIYDDGQPDGERWFFLPVNEVYLHEDCEGREIPHEAFKPSVPEKKLTAPVR